MEERVRPNSYAADFKGASLRVGINTWYPHVIQTTMNGSVVYTGYSIDILDVLAETLNFSYELVVPPDGEWGDYRDGNWTGLVGLIHRREIDMALALSTSYERSTVADWTVAYDYFYSVLAFTRDQTDFARWSAYLSPFQWQVYACVLGCFTGSVCIFMCLLAFGGGPVCSEKISTLLVTVEHMFGSLLNKAVQIHGLPGPTRAFFAAWCILGLLLTSSYTCKLTSLLVSVSGPLPFTSLRSMLEHDDFRWGTIGGSKLMTIFRDSENSVENAVYHGIMTFAEDDPEVLSHDTNVHLRKVLAGHYSFIGESSTVETWMTEHCGINMLPENVMGLETYNIFTPKNSSLTTKLDMILLRLQDSGVMSFLRKKWYPKRTSCQDNKEPSRAITMATLQGPFCLAAGGLVLAAITAAAEMLWGGRLLHSHEARRKDEHRD